MNALTEYYNAQNGTSLTPVYTYSSAVVRDSQDSNATACDNVVASSTADGFRLLTANEWELAGRYITDDGDGILDQVGEYYPGSHASGADAAVGVTSGGSDFDGDGDVEYYADVSWTSASPGSGTRTVKLLSPNALGLYDMSGNLHEFVFDLDGSYR